MDVLGIAYNDFTAEQRDAVTAAYSRGPAFKDNIIQAFYDGHVYDRPAVRSGHCDE